MFTRNMIPLMYLFLAACSSGKITTQRRYIFVDVGAARGASITAFKTTKTYKENSWSIYAIEPFEDAYQFIPSAPDVTIIPKAAAENNGKLELFKATPTGETTNSVFKNHLNEEKVSIESFDFSEWLMKSFKKEDYLILSMDAAGSELRLTEELLKTGAIDLIDRAYVEFSMEMLPDTDNTYHRVYRAIEGIRLRGIIFDKDSVEDVINERHSWISHL